MNRKQMGKRSGWGLTLAVLTLAAACVTVNIYFPAAEVKKAADQIVDDVYRESGVTPAKEEKGGGSSALGRLIALLGPAPAQAADATQISNPTIRGLKGEIASHTSQLGPYLQSGKVGIDANGFLAVRDPSGLNMQQLAQVRRLVDADNQTRRRLYQEVAQAMNVPDQAAQVQAIFANSWQSKAPAGWWIQAPGGAWRKK